MRLAILLSIAVQADCVPSGQRRRVGGGAEHMADRSVVADGFWGALYIEAFCAAVDVRRPEGDAFGDLADHLPVLRLALLEAQLQADLVVDRAAFGKGRQQRPGLDAAP